MRCLAGYFQVVVGIRRQAKRLCFVKIPEFLTGRRALMWSREADMQQEGLSPLRRSPHRLNRRVRQPAFLRFLEG